ncbi:hypothetical protein CORC01_05734 [Colletotrichum orchidophilum]|uniref:Uncharacterized protein n=1 Tax=Colletotrichum orchidophilum TaxID=1209926 RepID=A0A1G4BCC4_9PEZI|nr:uncharacterized protein CORC01_05734 [Colletotrichum orchidophilum]OHE99044.1 hypothetical protein CORC01_05734 [Colletotrichum orchidophilum]
MCSIGALYRLDRCRARRLWDLALRLIEPVGRHSTCSTRIVILITVKILTRDCPLGVLQTKFLLTFFATFSGDNDLAARSIGENTYFTLIWLQRESWKRLLGAIYVASTVNIVIYGLSPAFNASQDLEIEHFHDENLWNASSANEWRELRASHSKRNSRTTKDILKDVLYENTDDSRFESYHISPFTALVLMDAVLVHTWQLHQVSQTSCCGLLNQARVSQLEDMDDNNIPSLCFSSQAILRAAHIRLFDNTARFDRLSLLAEDPSTIDSCVATFANTKVERDVHVLKAIEKTLEGFVIPMRMGHMLVRKTAAFRWSVEHAVVAWDNALFTTKWAHSIELDMRKGIGPSAAELGLLEKMKDVLEEADYGANGSTSIAAGLAKTCSLLLQDVSYTFQAHVLAHRHGTSGMSWTLCYGLQDNTPSKHGASLSP